MAAMNAWSIPAPAPWAKTKQARASAGVHSSADTAPESGRGTAIRSIGVGAIVFIVGPDFFLAPSSAQGLAGDRANRDDSAHAEECRPARALSNQAPLRQDAGASRRS